MIDLLHASQVPPRRLRLLRYRCRRCSAQYNVRPHRCNACNGTAFAELVG